LPKNGDGHDGLIPFTVIYGKNSELAKRIYTLLSGDGLNTTQIRRILRSTYNLKFGDTRLPRLLREMVSEGYLAIVNSRRGKIYTNI